MITSNADRIELVALIARRAGVLDQLGRQNLLEDAGLYAEVVGKVRMGATAEAFSQDLVRVLRDEIGVLESTGRPALESLVRELRNRVKGHPLERAFLDGLLAGEAPATADPAPLAPIRSQATILFMAANPRQTSPLRLGEEVRTIEERLREAGAGVPLALKSAHAVRWTDVSRLLLEHRPQVVHFSGHGEQGGELLFERADGQLKAMDPEILADLFRILREDIRCVVLNACWSELQARAIGRHIDFVVGMRESVPDRAAIHFAAGFYRGLGFGRSVQTAFDLGCNEMAEGAGSGGARLKGIPSLLVRPGADAASTTLAGA